MRMLSATGRQDTVLKGQRTREDLLIMSFSEFVETVSLKWITTKKIRAMVIDEVMKRKFCTKDRVWTLESSDESRNDDVGWLVGA